MNLINSFLGAKPQNIANSNPLGVNSNNVAQAPTTQEVKPSPQAIAEKNRNEMVGISQPVLSKADIVLKDKLVLEILDTLKEKVPDIVGAALLQRNKEQAVASELQSENNELQINTVPETLAKTSEPKEEVKPTEAAVPAALDSFLNLLKNSGLEKLTQEAAKQGSTDLNPLNALINVLGQNPNMLKTLESLASNQEKLS